jgi:hypothetical protein
MAVAIEKRPNDTRAGVCRHAGETALARTAKEPQQDFLGLIVGIVSNGEFIEPVVVHHLPETAETEGTRRHLQGAAVVFLPGPNVQTPGENSQSKMLSQFGNEAGVLVRRSPPEAMVNMGDGEFNVQACPQKGQNVAERHRIRTARDRNQDAVSCPEHAVGSEGMLDLFQHGVMYPRVRTP